MVAPSEYVPPETRVPSPSMAVASQTGPSSTGQLDREYSSNEVVDSLHPRIVEEGECTIAEDGDAICPDDAPELGWDDFDEEV